MPIELIRRPNVGVGMRHRVVIPLEGSKLAYTVEYGPGENGLTMTEFLMACREAQGVSELQHALDQICEQLVLLIPDHKGLTLTGESYTDDGDLVDTCSLHVKAPHPIKPRLPMGGAEG